MIFLVDLIVQPIPGIFPPGPYKSVVSQSDPDIVPNPARHSQEAATGSKITDALTIVRKHVKRPKLIVILLAGGFLVLIAGGAIAASLPSWPSHKTTSTAQAQAPAPAHQSPSTPPTPSSPAPRAPGSAPSATEPAQAPKSTSVAAKASRAKKPPSNRSLTYVVKPGDNLSVIAAWFKLHGYGALYDWNKSVIGSNPNLIYPGERITISNGVMKLSGTRS